MSRSRIPKASDIIVAAVKKRILADRMPVGARLPSESELMEEFGLGRVTVREALRILERDGLVDVRRGPSGGIFVRHTDIRQVSETLELLFGLRETTLGEFADFRILLEPRVAALAAQNSSPEDRKRLLAVAEAEDDASRSADLHGMIAGVCGNDVYEFTLQAMQSSLVGHFRFELITPEHLDTTHRAHLKIVKAIAEGDVEGAERAMRRHLEQYAEYLKENGLENEPIVPRDRD